MNTNVSMKQPNQGNSQYHHLFSTVYRWSNAIPKPAITCRELHPSPPNSQPFPV
jgi:hypothetical protein